MTESRGNAKVYPREVSSMRSFVTSSLPSLGVAVQ